MEFDRVVQVRVPQPQAPGRAAFASGYVVAPRLVLTAAHVLGPGQLPCGVPVTICRPEVSEQRFAAKVLWHRNDDTVDAALMAVDPNSGWTPPRSVRDLLTHPPQRWGHLIGTRPHPVTICGFPRMQKGPAGRAEEQVVGDIHPGTGRLANRYEVLSSQPVPPYASPLGSPATRWSGISGAALMCGDLLTGLVAQDRRAPAGVRLTATRARDLLDDDDFQAFITQHTGWRPLLEPVEPANLLTPAAPARDLRSPATLLRADTEAVAFHGRGTELRQLLDWCHSPQDPFAVRVLVGPGGQGKTRLARQLASVLREAGWVAAQVRPDLADHTDDSVPDWSALETRLPLLLIVDYAETLPHQVRRLIEQLRHTRHQTRLLLVARTEGEWKTAPLGAGPETREILATAPTTTLSPLLDRATGPADRCAAFIKAAQDLATLLGQVPSLRGTDWQTLASGIRPPKGLADPGYDTALTFQMAALSTLLELGPDPVGSVPGQPAEAVLLGHEARYWEGSAASPLFRLGDLRPVTLRRAVAAATLCGAATQAEAIATTQQVPGLSPDRIWDVTEWLQALYPPSPGRYWGSLQPDRLAEYHATVHLTAPEFQALTPLWTAAGDDQRVRIITVLGRAANAHAEAGRSAASRAVQMALKDALNTSPPAPQVLRDGSATLPYPTRSRTIALLDRFLHAHLVRACRRLASASPGDHDLEVALAFNSLSLRLKQAGQPQDALWALKRAIAVDRRLARTTPESAEPALTMALYNMSHLLGSRPAEAVTALEEAVAVERRLLKANSHSDESYLAMYLYRLSQLLRRTGRQAEGLTAAEESVSTYRRLAQVNPLYDASLARSLTNLGIQLQDFGRPDDGLAALNEGLDVRHRCGVSPLDSHAQLQAGLRQRSSRGADESGREVS
ncbi:hypothetical protein PH213_39860 [Streptomyces sp. SRF1]|uniref:P-loop NTPase n=1 Tax=Streptomyces sp. SRF1 TaxID=1549642 RepID=UPI0025B0243A|nr:hypothetical protein [Streptomyces sp. SRF1]MDN3060563.1 hypothetical protein [Streptomyces sp. SRF1]